MELDRTTLEQAHCWFGSDRVPGDPAMTAFKREARFRQAMWRDAAGWPPGTHANTKKAIEAGGPARITNGSKLPQEAGEAGINFLSDTVRAAVVERLAYREDHETLGRTRLREDLLSSMPMCFNLFGELVHDPERARAAVDLLLPGARPGPVEVKFEWSPQRRSPRYTNDRTAFDLALLIGSADGPRDFVGIETKYHEHATREPTPKPAARPRREEQTRFLRGAGQRDRRVQARLGGPRSGDRPPPALARPPLGPRHAPAARVVPRLLHTHLPSQKRQLRRRRTAVPGAAR